MLRKSCKLLRYKKHSELGLTAMLISLLDKLIPIDCGNVGRHLLMELFLSGAIGADDRLRR